MIRSLWRATRRSTEQAEHPETEAREAAASRSVLTYRTGVSDANMAGDVHGGWIMKLCDDVAVIAASRHSECRVVTLAVDGVLFRSPVKVGSVVTLKAMVNAAWHSSMEVGVRVEAEDPRTGGTSHTLTAYFTMVALDSKGQPTQVPSLRSSAGQDLRRRQEADLRRRIRLADPADLHRSFPGSSRHLSGGNGPESDEMGSAEESSDPRMKP